jgi:hypothetical protein
MDTSKMESTDIRQVEALLQAQLENVSEESDRIRLVSMVDDYFSLLKRTQSLPVLQRLYFFDCVYVVFCYLHLKGQLRRHKEQFDEACVNDLNQMFKRLYERI